jgi:hypothetical protein
MDRGQTTDDDSGGNLEKPGTQRSRSLFVRKPWLRPLRPIVLFLLVPLAAWFVMIRMPSTSYDGPWEPLSEAEEAVRERLVHDVEKLALEIGDRNIEAYENYLRAAEFIESTLKQAGYDVNRHEFDAAGRTCINLEAERPGLERPEEILVIGAHYDSVFGTPAANDNATGVAAMLELARTFAELEPARTVRFVAFANEEPPFFQTEDMGSLVYARHIRERGDNVIGMVSLETLGYYSDEPGSQQYPFPFQLLYPNEGNFLAFVSNVRSRRLLHKGIRAFRENTLFPSEGAAIPSAIVGVGWSDHWAFWQEGFPAFMVTDTALFRYPYYHTRSDTPDKLDFDRLSRVVVGLGKMAYSLAE